MSDAVHAVKLAEAGYLWLVPAIPALGAAVLALFGRRLEYPGKDAPPWGNDPARWDWHAHDHHGHDSPAGHGHDSHGSHGHGDHGHGDHGHDDHDHGHHGLAPGQSQGGMNVVNAIANAAIWIPFLITCYAAFQIATLPEGVVGLHNHLYQWLFIGKFSADMAFVADRLSILPMFLVTGVGGLIHIYSMGYMAHDENHWRFMAYLNMFCCAMLLLVMGDNLFIMFIGWEGVGLASYCLIGFWHKEMANATAAIKAFVVNRVGDFFFVIGVALIWWNTGTLNFFEINAQAGNLAQTAVGVGAMSVATLATLCLFGAATGKSAQIPLYVWLPDAMAGPTPVSALIHAATMVTAGVFMIGRLNMLFAVSPATLTVIAIVATATAFFSATIGITQYDIKKVLAYSTVSQLGFMFMGMATGAFWAGIFHLMTHAFFKACLFLGSGSVIMGNHHEQDMRKYGGLKRLMPVTYATFGLATLAIAGIPPFAGFFSKDEILHKMWGSHHFGFGPEMPLPHLGKILFFVGLAAAAMTAFYMTRQVCMTFFGENRADPKVRDHIHESPRSVTIPLVVLAFLSVFGGFLGFFFVPGWNVLEHFLEPVMPGMHHIWGDYHAHAGEAVLFAVISVAVAGSSILAARAIYTKKPETADNFVRKFPNLHSVVYRKYLVDEGYDATFVSGTMGLSRLSAWFDSTIVDGLVNLAGRLVRGLRQVAGWFDRVVVDKIGVEGTAWVSQTFGSLFRQFQTGRIQTYIVFVMACLILALAFLIADFGRLMTTAVSGPVN
ncbi:MAG: NADH-quinone oxidoreductase subunit L [Deltaproteobacteria bacterium]|nr:NADH-quinone oxidoreductase subunit L [Deltaproteobacteria bacterium]